jgi:pyruvate/2-oxoglutarate dehydrogenase complex dihydrolipoamide acyltransferase (E2) component
MAIEIKLPNLGDGVDSGDIIDVLVKEGDQVAKDQGILEIETGKATMQVPSPAAGKVQKLHVAKGQSIPVGALLLTLEGSAAEPAAKPTASAAKAPPKSEPASKPAEAAPQAAAQAPRPTPAAPKPAPVAPQPDQPAPAAPVATLQPATPMSDVEVAAGPAVRRFAREVGVDLSRVVGSGPSGRVTRDDVLAVVRSTSQAATNGGGAAQSSSTAAAHAERDQWGPVRIEKMAKIRKTIAAKMHESWSTVPRVTNFDDADVTELEKIRSSSKEDYARKGIKLTQIPFVVKAVAMALRLHPSVNASIDMENGNIIYKQYVNVGIAVDTERGLVVPSLRGADEMSIPDIARAVATLAESVRESNFSLSDLQGSTFTISNLGAIGGTYSTPIINTPEVAILLIGRSRKLPVIINDKVEVRLMMPMSLSYDHRLVDGATAARFLNDVIDFLKMPSRLLLAP